MKKKDFIAMKAKEKNNLEKEILGKKKEITLLYAKIKSGQEKNTSKLRNLKRDVARILTLIREKEIFEKERSRQK